MSQDIDPGLNGPAAEPAESRTAGASPESAGSLWDTLSPPAEVDAEEAEEMYEDPAVTEAAADAEDVPEWLGTRWRELFEESMPEVWTWLRGWVDWLVEAHRIPADEIPPCWFRHGEIVEELWAAANAEAQAWEATTATMTPMTAWHFHLRMMRDRLAGKAKECVGKQSHVPQRSYRPGWGPGALVVDEGDWAAHMAEIRDTQPVAVSSTQTVALWRMCAVDEAGQIVSSEAVEVGPVARLAPVTVSTPARRGTDTAGSVLLGSTVVTGTAGISRTWWESSPDGGVSWEKVTTSEVERAIAQTADQDGPDDNDEQAGERA